MRRRPGRSGAPRIEVLESRNLLAAGVGDDNFSVGDQLRHYRLAIAATAEYTEFIGGQAQAFAQIQSTVDDLNEIFQRELSIRFDLISTIDTVFTDAASDGYTNGDVDVMVFENTSILNAAYSSSAYDIGHVFGTGTEGGYAYAEVVNTSTKGRGVSTSQNPAGPSFVNLVAHEIGHQFGAHHTFNVNKLFGGSEARESGNAFEPASGSTLMSYAGTIGDGNDLQEYPDQQFHSASFEQVAEFVAGVGTPSSTTPTGNNIPVVDAGVDYVIPAQTPFQLSAVGMDADPMDSLTYTWDQMNLGSAQGLPVTDDGSRPLFRSFPPTIKDNRVFPRLSDLVAGVDTAAIGEGLPTTTRDLDFRVTVRDGNGGVNSDDVALSVVNTGVPFAITSTGADWTGGTSQTLVWNVAGTTTAAGNGINTDFVAIDLSLDGGLSYPIQLSGSTANDGTFTFDAPNINASQARVRVQGLGNVFFAISDADITITSSSGSPGITITETDGGTLVGEDGVVDGQTVDTYEIARTTSTAGTTTVEVTTGGHTEVSTDGVHFFTSLSVDLSGTTPATITVRGLDDSLDEAIHTDLISHSVTSSIDPSYSAATIIRSLNATIADDEWQPVIGVDFDVLAGKSPDNWTKIVDLFDGFYANLIREDGFSTNIALDVAVETAAQVFEMVPDETPLHSPRLDGIDGSRLATESFTLTWSGLAPGADYNVYVIASEWFTTQNILQTVHVTGQVNAPEFVQNSRLIDNGVLVNGNLADEDRPLESDAVVAQADSNGEIKIVVSNVSPIPGEDSILSGVAIQRLAPDAAGFTISQSDSSTRVSEAGAQDTFDVTLTSAPTGTVVIDLTVQSPHEVSISPATLTFDNTNWNVSQPITVTGVDDSASDGDQYSNITLSIDPAITTDNAFDEFSDRVISVLTLDDETGPLIGIDIGFNDTVVNNWTDVESIFTVSGSDMIAEDGTSTSIDLSSLIVGSENSSNYSPPASTIPQHTQSLGSIGGYSAETTGQTFTATWEDLIPGTQYHVYVFGLENEPGSFSHDVTMTGANTVSFTQTLTHGELSVNDAVGSDSNSLDSYARFVTADAGGQIQLSIAPSTGSTGISLAGLAIQAFGQSDSLTVRIDDRSISENGGIATATVIRHNGTSGDLTINLSSSDTGEATVPASVTIPDGADRVTFDVSAVDDAVIDGSQSAEITATAAGLTEGKDLLVVLDDDAFQNPLVGVDFDEDNVRPINWTTVGGVSTPYTEMNLTDESGAATNFDLTISGAAGSTSDYTADPDPSTIPIHAQSLDNIEGQIFTDANPVTFQWSDLTPGKSYQIYVFGLESFYGTISQEVVITGQGAPITLTQVFNTGQLFINDQLGSDSRTLDSYAQVIPADATGQITIEVNPINGSSDVSLGGLAIRELGAPTPQDFGDAPASYKTLSADQGAAHWAVGPRLGDSRDGESDGQPSAAADGDGDDEDGVMFGLLTAEMTMAAVNVDLQNAAMAKIDAWIDFNQDGDWDDPNEKILNGADVVGGMQTLNYSVPAGIIIGETFARVRVSTAGGLDVTGVAPDGEVEDYKISVLPQRSVDAFIDNANNLIVQPVSGPGLDDDITIENDGTHLRIRDASYSVVAGNGVSQDNAEVIVPVSSVSGPLGVSIDTGSGTDTVTLNGYQGTLPNPVAINIDNADTVLAGDLQIDLASGFTPSVGQSFLLVQSSDGIAQSFSAMTLPTAPADTQWDLIVTATEVRLNLISVPPRIVEVRVGSTHWNQAFRNKIDPQGQGYLVSTGTNQLADVPFNNANQIFIEFDQPVFAAGGVELDRDQFQVIGSPTLGINYPIDTAIFDESTNTAILTLQNHLTADKLLLHIDDGAIENAQGAALDGEWTTGRTTPSGDTNLGGVFHFRMDVLPGNVNDDLLTNTTDLSFVRSLGTQIAGVTTEFNARANVNGDLLVNTTDLSVIRAMGTQLLLGLDDPTPPA
ncbi:reprolysin-like metallopeptidase [Stieleria varia]|nr:zinc-dependent metalloprotease family protein [Stieleria varia]